MEYAKKSVRYNIIVYYWEYNFLYFKFNNYNCQGYTNFGMPKLLIITNFGLPKLTSYPYFFLNNDYF